MRLGSQKDISAALTQRGAVVIHAARVSRRRVEVVHTYAESAVNDPDRFSRAAISAEDALAAEAEQRHFLSGFSQGPAWQRGRDCGRHRWAPRDSIRGTAILRT